MNNQETINLKIPPEKINEFIVQKLVDLEAKLQWQNDQIIGIVILLNNKNERFNQIEFVKNYKEEIRNYRLEIIAEIIKRYT